MHSLQVNSTSKRCPSCNGTFWITKLDNNGCEVAARCKCFKGEQSQRRLRFAELPKAYAGMKLVNFSHDVYQSSDTRKQIAMVKESASVYVTRYKEMLKAGRGLYLYSKTKGSGKTRLAVSIANELLDKKVKVKFATSTKILQEIKRSWDGQTGYTESSLLDDLITVELLIIDDFGTEKVSDWVNEKFYHIVNERYINKRPTIFTSNDHLNDLTYNDRITNRIKEQSFIIHFPEESIRNYIATDNTKEMARMIVAERET